MHRILASRLVDRDYYELQTGARFDTGEAAVRHYLRKGAAAGFSLHPLVEPEWIRPGSHRAKPDPLIDYLLGRSVSGPGPLFDEEAHLARFPEAEQDPGRALGHFLATATADDPLPVPVTSRVPAPTLDEALRLGTSSAREWRTFAVRRTTPRRGSWDEEAGRAFVEQHRRAREAAPARGRGAKPLVSVVMPVRNRPVQVVDAIRSVQAQTLDDWELIVVDDGSTDDTADVVERLAAEDPRIKLHRNEKTGVSGARNRGVEGAEAQWLAFLDSDNSWVEHFLEVMVEHLEGHDLRAGHAVVDARGADPDAADRYLAFEGGLEDLLVFNHIDLNGLMVQAEVARAVGGFDTSMRRWVDHDFALRIARQNEIPLVPFVGVRYDHSPDGTDRITTTESDHWQWVALGKNYADWPAVDAALSTRVRDRVSICMPTFEDWQLTRTAVDAVLAEADRQSAAGGAQADVEIVIIVNGSRRAVPTMLRALYRTEPRVRIRAVPLNMHFATGSNLAFAESTGSTIVFLNNDTQVLPGWLAPLLAELEDPDVVGTQPLLLYPDGTIQSAGTIFLGGDLLPTPLLVNHPPEDARRAAPIRLHVVTAAALAMRAEDVARLRGFDPLYVNGFEDVDLCLRAVENSERRFTVATESVVLHHESRTPGRGANVQANRRIWMDRWHGRLPDSEVQLVEGLGFAVAHVDPGPPVREPEGLRMPRLVLVRPATLVESGPAAGQPSLRWAIKTGVPVREDSATSPDLILARDLARSLERLGQDVVVDRVESHQRPTSFLDDVVVTLRRDEPFVTAPGRVNIGWFVGPRETPVEAAEAACYDGLIEHTADDVHPDLDELAKGLVDLALDVRSRSPWPRPSLPE